MQGTYYRWTRDEHQSARLHADILGSGIDITADLTAERVEVTIERRSASPDEARMIGVRLIEAAALAAGASTVRER